ncbi:hypothetical protein J7E97_08030 [Streptomyces sp. ISL-66]|uniref:hypothetical protein n=1 Tax=Streptomyces sp. ISL-66 TaxID=2819186 RepID=UPI001BE9333B|nr:hypothetical protein [Streptomyces sp. ISL-66]MBT2467821.1 hypothetical protein [Streptomyces sp. ISL-66]
MAASAQSGHSIIDRPATAQTCSQDYQAAQAQRAESAGAQRDQLGSATGAGPHTNR